MTAGAKNAPETPGQQVIRPTGKAFKPTGGLIILKGNLAEEGCVLKVAGSGIQLTDAGAVGGVELGANADQVTVTIKDANGLVINTVNLGRMDAGLHNFTWDGKNDAGVRAVNGSYSISVSATRGSAKVTATGLQLAGVQNINRSTQGVSLNLGTLGLVTLNDIKQIF